MNKEQFAIKLAVNLGVNKTEGMRIVNKVIETFHLSFEDKEVQVIKLRGLGVFKRTQKKARQGRNPQTGEHYDIPAYEVVTFKPSKNLKWYKS